MKRRVLSMNYTANHADDGIARIIGVVMTSCGAAALFIAGSSMRWLSLELHLCMHIPALNRERRTRKSGGTYRCTSHAGIWHARAREQPAQRAQRHCANQ